MIKSKMVTFSLVGWLVGWNLFFFPFFSREREGGGALLKLVNLEFGFVWDLDFVWNLALFGIWFTIICQQIKHLSQLFTIVDQPISA